MKKIAAMLIMSAMAGQVVADTVSTGTAGGRDAVSNARGFSAIAGISIAASVSALALVAMTKTDSSPSSNP